MTSTPWGLASDLRERERTGTPAQRTRAIRERIHAAMVTSVAERGYAATEVDQVVELAGVTRADFEAQFDGRLHCFVETLEAIVVLAEASMAVDLVRDAPWDARLRRSFETLVDLIVAHPAAARMCLVDAYDAGPEAMAYVDRMTRAAGRRAVAVLEQSPERAGMPRDVARAIIGGLRKVIQTRLYDDRVDELPDLAPALMDWALDYRAPAVPLRAGTPPETVATTAATAIAARTSVGAVEKELPDSFDATLDDAVARMLDATTIAYRGAPDWPHGVRDGFEALFAYLSKNPDTATFISATVWAGPRVMIRLDTALTGFTALLAEGLRGRSGAPGVAAEAIGSSILALAFERISNGAAAALYAIAPTAAFIAIAPSVGTIEACAVINDG